MSEIRVIANQIFLRGLPVAIITIPEGTSFHEELIEHLINPNHDEIQEAYQAGRDQGYTAGFDYARDDIKQEIRDGKHENYIYKGGDNDEKNGKENIKGNGESKQ